MSKVSLFIVAVVVIVLGLVAKGALYTVSEMEQAIVMQFGEPIRVINEPGLSYKLPLVQDVQYYEKRVLNLDPPFETMLLSDQKRVLIDSFVRYQIKDPLEFFKTVRSEQTVRARLSTITNSVVRDVVGNSTLTKVLSEERTQLLAEIVQKLNIPASQFGIQIVDVRFRRTDLPDEVSERVYARMRAEREREAKEFRAEGFEVAQEITANGSFSEWPVQIDVSRPGLKVASAGREVSRLETRVGSAGHLPGVPDNGFGPGHWSCLRPGTLVLPSA